MIRIRDTRYPSTAAFLGDAIKVAEYYGFVSADDMPKNGNETKKPPTSGEIEALLSFARREERSLPAIARRALMFARPTHEAMLMWRIVQTPGTTPLTSLELHIVGHASAMAETLAIIVGHAIAENAGLTGHTLSINNLGSGESSGRFARDVGTFLRKHLDTIAPSLRSRVADDPLGALIQLIERGHPATGRAPQAMEYLTEDERRRFWEFLEYLEVFGLPYELSSHVLGSRDVWSHALYEISSMDPETGTRVPFAFGGRYDPVISRFAKRPESGAMLSITVEAKGAGKPKRSNRVMPSIFFAHLGAEARRRALAVIEDLRRAEIPIRQSLTFDRLGEQMTMARTLQVPYILIMGHKEAVENAILVREVATNNQEVVPLAELSGYLKRRRLGTPRAEVHA